MPIQNRQVRERTFLQTMLADSYFPKHLVGKGQDVLRELAERIEREAPEGEAVYGLTRATAQAFNELQEEFLAVLREAWVLPVVLGHLMEPAAKAAVQHQIMDTM